MKRNIVIFFFAILTAVFVCAGASASRGNHPGTAQGHSERSGKPDGDKPGSGRPTEYNASNVVSEDSSGISYSSSSDSENAVLVSGKVVTIADASVNKTGSASGDEADFYGINAAVLAKDGSTLTISGTTVVTDGGHANGIFSYGSGTTVNVSDTTITTSGNNSGGLMTTGGAALNAENLNVSTGGNSSAAIRSDRGGGTVNVTGGTYSSAGVGSPAIYSTADITVSNAVLSSAVSEAVVIEGGNSVTLNLTNQSITGSILQDSVSSVTVNLSGNSTWKLLGDSYISGFSGDMANVDLNGYTLYINGIAYN